MGTAAGRSAAAPLAAAEARPLGQATLQSNPALADAFKALRKIHAATRVGITRSEYGKLVVDAQAVLNDVSPATAQSDVRLVHSELATAMQAYVDAGTWWQFADNLKPMDHGVFLRLVRTYTLPVSQVGGGNLTPAKDEALARIWQDAAWHLDRAAQAAGGAHDDVGRIESADGSSGRT